MKKQYIYIITIVLGVMILGFSFSYYINDEEPLQKKRPIPERIKIIKNVIKEPVVKKEKVTEISMDNIFEVEEIPQEVEIILSEEEKDSILQKEIQARLETRMNFIYKQCKTINTQKGIQQKFQKMQYEDVFLSDLMP